MFSAATSSSLAATLLFVAALLHTFATGLFNRLARRYPRHAGSLHLLGEVEVVFGFWALVLVLALTALEGGQGALAYLEAQDFTGPLFVFVVMVIAATRPVLRLAQATALGLARVLPGRGLVGFYFVALLLLPLLGSFITEAAAMTVAALLLRDRLYAAGPSPALQYVTLGVLFVNVSVGGTLTTFAAPPVLMVARSWGWDNLYMLEHFGGRAVLAVALNAALATFCFRRELAALGSAAGLGERPVVPWGVTLVHLAFLALVVGFAHHPVVFVALLLFFLGFAQAYERHQDPLLLREGLLVAFFLAGLVVLGGLQRWWLEPALAGMGSASVYYGATVLTAVTDNAALTYLGSLVEGLSPEFRRALVAGAVTGGGLTVIANAPNPAGYSILRASFTGGLIRPAGLAAAALLPTLIVVGVFRLL